MTKNAGRRRGLLVASLSAGQDRANVSNDPGPELDDSLTDRLGGAVGSVCRYLFGAFVNRLVHAGPQYGTLAVNIIGSIAIGMLTRFFLHSQTETMRAPR